MGDRGQGREQVSKGKRLGHKTGWLEQRRGRQIRIINPARGKENRHLEAGGTQPADKIESRKLRHAVIRKERPGCRSNPV
jgi:hypothetical protein